MLKDRIAGLDAEAREYRERFDRLVENLNGMAYRCANDASWTMEFVSIGAKALTGYGPEHLIGNRNVAYGDLIHVDDRPMVWDAVQAALCERRGFRMTYRIHDVFGKEKWVWEQGRGVFDDEGSVVALEGYITDISELKESEVRYRSLFTNNHAVMLIVDPDGGGIVDANPAACAFYGWSHEELLSKSVSDINTLSFEQVRTEMAAAVAQKRKHFIFQHRLADGSTRDVDVYSGPIQVRNRQFLFSIIHDITARKQAEAALRESEAKFRLTFDSSPDAVNVNRLEDGLYVDINDGFTRLTGFTREDVIGKTSLQINIWHNPEDRQKLVRGLRENGFYENLEAQFRRKDGSLGIGLMSARTILIRNEPHIISITRDITEQIQSRVRQKMLEDQLHQAQRLESVGRLAGGVAHDLNNLLSPILGYGEMLQEDIASHDHRRDAVDQILQAAIRARDVIRQLLSFSRKQTMVVKLAGLNQVVEGFAKLLRRTIREDIEIRTLLTSGLPSVRVDIGQIEQVIMNLAINAQDAMPAGGLLTIRTESTVLDERFCAHHPGSKPGTYAMLSVSDTGFGMDDETAQHIFEPFFSTKGEHGTGLGLASVYGIVKQHDGYIWVESEPGKGTTFKVYLPATEEPSQADETSGEKTAGMHGTETVLIAEDNDQIRVLGHNFLSRLGYTVLIAEKGREALEVLEKQEGRVHLLLTDVVMPDMNGRDLFVRASEKYSTLKVLYMSGYSGTVLSQRGVLEDGVRIIQKPFSVRDLATKIREVLDKE